MSKLVRTSHVEQGNYRSEMLVSILGHVVLYLFFLVGTELFPQGSPLVIGKGLNGNQGGAFTTVGLTANPGGGAGMYKPSLTPSPRVLPAISPRKSERKRQEASQQDSVFTSKRPRNVTQKSLSEKDGTNQPGTIPRKPDPGSGGQGEKKIGTGGVFDGDKSVRIGTSAGGGPIDSWYARRVEQRIGRNWLQTSLGHLNRSVKTVVSFEIRSDGKIENLQLERVSGVRSVDIAAQRAIMASDPLPPVPYEFRHRRVRFIAYFEYPPK